MIRLIQRRLIIPRGDTGAFSVPISSAADSSVAVFTIFDCLTQKKMFQKIVGVEGDAYTIAFSHNETVNLKPGIYNWDIKFYSNPQYIDEQLVNGDKVDSCYAGYNLPICEIRETGDSYLTSDEAPTSTLTPQQLDVITDALTTVNAAVEETKENVSHYPTIQDGIWYIWDADNGEYVSTNVRAEAVGIENTVMNDDYTLTFSYTDGTSYTTPSLKGDDGDDYVLSEDDKKDIAAIAVSNISENRSYVPGQDLSAIFETPKELHDALLAEDYSNIHIGDYWPITLNGSFKNYSQLYVPADVVYYATVVNSGGSYYLNNPAGKTTQAYSGSYYDLGKTIIRFYLSGKYYYCYSTSGAYGYSMNIASQCNLVVAGINFYYGKNFDTTPRLFFMALNSPVSLAANVGYKEADFPWLSSGLYESLNDEENGVYNLLKSSGFTDYIINSQVELEKCSTGDSYTTAFELTNRGKIFIPTEYEFFGTTINSGYGENKVPFISQPLPIFSGSNRYMYSLNGMWTCSPTWNSSSLWCYVDRNQRSQSNMIVSNIYQVPFCFII